MSVASVLDRFPKPPCASHLGFDLLAAERDSGVVRIGFMARPEFCNPTGHIQGGFLSAMLDDCMGPAVLIATDGAVFPMMIDLHVQFLAPAKPGVLVGTARVVRLGSTIGFVESDLADPNGSLVARASASVRLAPIAKASGGLVRPIV